MTTTRSRSCKLGTRSRLRALLGADKFGSPAFVTANQKLAAAEAALAGKKSAERKTAPGLAREAVIAGEDARRAALLASTETATAERQLAASAAATNAANEAARVAAAETAATTAAAAAGNAPATAAAASSQAASQAGHRGRARASRSCGTRRVARSLERGTAHARLESRARRRNKRSAVRDRNGECQRVRARESLEVLRHRGFVSGAAFQRRRSYGQHGQRRDEPGAVAQACDDGARLPDRAGCAGIEIDVAGLGLSAPIGDNTTTDGRARNRRVEIVVSGGPLISGQPLGHLVPLRAQ